MRKIVHVNISSRFFRVGYDCLFGIHQLERSSPEVVITGSEWDAIALYQAAGKGALALPKGDSFLPQKVGQLLSFIEVFIDNCPTE